MRDTAHVSPELADADPILWERVNRPSRNVIDSFDDGSDDEQHDERDAA